MAGQNTTESVLIMTTEAVLRNVTGSPSDIDGHDHDHDHETLNGAGNGLMIAKVVAMLVLGVVSFALGMLPVKLAKCLHWNKEPSTTGSGKSSEHLVISLLLCFGGGVLLYTTFLHLQPEVREGFIFLQKKGDIPEMEHGIHLAELVFCAGFFFVYLVEELVHVVLDRRAHEREDEAVLHRTMSLRRCSRHPVVGQEENAPTMIPRVSLGSPPTAATATVTKKADEVTNGSTGSSMTASTQGLLNNSSSLSTIMIMDSGSKPSPLDAQVRMSGGPLHHHHHHHHHQHHAHHHSHGHSHAIPFKDDDDGASTSSSTMAKSFRGLLAVLALSFHAVFEGLAVGLETSVVNVWYLFGAIATHKLVIAFCVGVELISSRTRLALILVYIATFAAVTPLGIGVGLALSNAADSNTSTVATVVLQGMAAGTLLYVVFFEVLQRERANTQSGMWQLLAIMAGFAVMFGLQIATGHEHNHGGGGSGHDEHGQIHFHDHDHDLDHTLSNASAILGHDHHHHHHHH